MDEVAELLRAQDGVIARSQALAAGLTRTAVARAVRRREWVPIQRGVYVNHTGPPTWQQRAWAAVLSCWPAALYGSSALRAYDGPGRRGAVEHPVHVAVGRDVHRGAPAGVRLHRVTDLDDRVLWQLGPPRIRYDETVLDLAAEARDELAAVAVLADACGARRTTARRLLAALAERRRIGRRRFLVEVLTDVAEGTCSVLEHGYLTRVERAHGLPTGRRQAEHLLAGGRVLRDVEYAELRLVVELDGRAFHESPQQRDRDLDRDLLQAIERDGRTVRLGYGQVFRRGCATAAQLGRLMRRLGWAGEPTRCRQCDADSAVARINQVDPGHRTDGPAGEAEGQTSN